MSEKPAHEEADEHTVHRVESFSDIVMGFCLAEVGVSLTIPGTHVDLRSIGENVGAFAISFVMIGVLWWLHHRLFTRYLVFNAVTLTMNFAMLGGLILMLYFLQITVHMMVADVNPSAVLRLWMFSFAFVYALLGGMLAMGLRTRWATLSPADQRWGVRRAGNLGVAVVMLTGFGIVVTRLHNRELAYAAVAVALFSFVSRRIVLPIFLRNIQPAA